MTMCPRKRLHVAFFIFPEFADTIPTLSVVSALVRRGYRVSYVTTDRFASTVSELGAECIRCPALRESPNTDGKSSTANPLVTLTAETLSRVTPFYQQNKPDLVIHDCGGFAGRILARKLEVPTIQVSSDFLMNRR